MTEQQPGHQERQWFDLELGAIEAKVIELFTMVAEDLPRAVQAGCLTPTSSSAWTRLPRWSPPRGHGRPTSACASCRGLRNGSLSMTAATIWWSARHRSITGRTRAPASANAAGRSRRAVTSCSRTSSRCCCANIACRPPRQGADQGARYPARAGGGAQVASVAPRVRRDHPGRDRGQIMARHAPGIAGQAGRVTRRPDADPYRAPGV